LTQETKTAVSHVQTIQSEVLDYPNTISRGYTVSSEVRDGSYKIEDDKYEKTATAFVRVDRLTNVNPKPNSNTKGIDGLTEPQYQFVIELCGAHDIIITPQVIFAVMDVESDFDLEAVSTTNDYGIMQVNKKYFRDYLNKDPELLKLHNISVDDYNMLDFKTNVIAGYNALLYWEGVARQKSSLNVTSILASYNQGFNFYKRGYSKNAYPKLVTAAMKNY